MIRIATSLIISILGLVTNAPLWAKSVWIDTDPACGISSTSDVDDCWALHLAYQSKGIDIKGISTVYGNAEGVQTYHKAREVLTRIIQNNVSIPIFRGNDEKINISDPQENDATTALVNQLKLEPTTILALGPLTNIATVLLRRPDLAKQVERVLVVAGRQANSSSRFYPGDTSIMHLHDFNFRKDVEAFVVLLESTVPVTMIPYELASKVKITDEDLNHVSSNPRIHWLAKASLKWLSFWQKDLRVNGFFPFDSLAVHHLVSPSSYQCDQLKAKIIRRPSLFLKSRDDLIVSDEFEQGRLVTYCYDIDREHQPDFFLNQDLSTMDNSSNFR